MPWERSCTARPCSRAGREKLLNLFGSSSNFSPLCVCGGSSSLLGYAALGGQSKVLVVLPALPSIQDVTCLRPWLLPFGLLCQLSLHRCCFVLCSWLGCQQGFGQVLGDDSGVVR